MTTDTGEKAEQRRRWRREGRPHTKDTEDCWPPPEAGRHEEGSPLRHRESDCKPPGLGEHTLLLPSAPSVSRYVWEGGQRAP